MELTPYIDAYRGPLIGLIASWGAPWTDAAEIAQDSFADAWLNRANCRGDWRDPELFGHWLRGVARNRFRNWRRARRRRWLRVLNVEPTTLDQVAAPATTELADDFEPLRKAIERLPPRQRQVVLMHYLEETSVRRVAALLSVSERTVEGRLYQARRALRRMLGNHPTWSRIARVFLCLSI